MYIDKVWIDDILSQFPFDRVAISCFSDAWVSDVIYPSDIEARLKCKITNGASKMVIIPQEPSPFVIKIPFYGYWTIESEFTPFTKARYIKSHCEGWDYCKAEMEIWAAAAQQGLEQFFCPGIYYKNYQDFPIYIYERANLDFPATWKEDVKFVEDFCWQHGLDTRLDCNKAFLAQVIRSQSTETVLKLIDFLKSYSITDLHQCNLGFNRRRSPIILDYGGFYEGEDEIP